MVDILSTIYFLNKNYSENLNLKFLIQGWNRALQGYKILFIFNQKIFEISIFILFKPWLKPEQPWANCLFYLWIKRLLKNVNVENLKYSVFFINHEQKILFIFQLKYIRKIGILNFWFRAEMLVLMGQWIFFNSNSRNIRICEILILWTMAESIPTLDKGFSSLLI